MIFSKVKKILFFFSLFLIFFSFNTQNSEAVSCPDGGGGFYSCANPGACQLDSGAGTASCQGSWVVSYSLCFSGGGCYIEYTCSSNCIANGTYIDSAVCGSPYTCSYGTSGSTCVVNVGTCSYSEYYPQGSSPSGPTVSNGSSGDTNICTDIDNSIHYSMPWGQSFSVSQGDAGWIGFQVETHNPAGIEAVVDGCPVGATCTIGSPVGTDGDGNPPSTVSMNITGTSSLAPGTYTMSVALKNLTDTGCTNNVIVYLVVEPSRRTVCDSNWYTVTGTFAAYQNPIGKYFSTSATMNVFAPNASTGRNINEQVCTGATSGQTCLWNGLPGWTNTSNFSSVVNQAVNIPAAATSRTAIASTLSNGMFQLGNSGWQVYSGATPTWGNPNSTSDPFGRTYQFRRGSGNVVEYMCTANQPDLNVDTLSVIGTLNTGQSLGFRGTVRNTGTASTIASQARLRVDIGNNGSWDVTVSPNQSTGVLAPSGSEIETWNSAWTATAGTHRFEICADTTSVVTESNESNNCSLAGTGVFTVTTPSAVPDINVSPSTINSGQSSTVSWTSTGATSCAVSCSPAGSCSWTGTSGSQSSGALSANKTYTLTCQPGSTTDSATVTVNAASNPILNVIKSGQGTVTSSPSGISCGTDCSQAYVLNTSVTLTATPSAGRIFTGWSGHCTGRGTETSPGSGVFTCTLNINGDKSVTANFAIDPNYKEF